MYREWNRQNINGECVKKWKSVHALNETLKIKTNGTAHLLENSLI